MLCSIIITLLLLSIIISLLYYSYYQYKKIEQIQKEFYFDELTKIYNRKFMNDKLKDIAKYYYVITADIDKFKNVNDTYGHLTGDRILRFFAKSLKNEMIPAADYIIRYGGEEFTLFFDKNKYKGKEVLSIIESFRENLSNKQIQLDPTIIDKELLYKIQEERPSIKITASFGVCLDENLETLEQKIKYSDEKLYQAKELGRNCVVS